MNKKQVKEQIPLDYIKVTVINSKTGDSFYLVLFVYFNNANVIYMATIAD